MVNISLQFHESMVLAAEFFGSQYQNINYLPDNSLKLVIEIFSVLSMVQLFKKNGTKQL